MILDKIQWHEKVEQTTRHAKSHQDTKRNDSKESKNMGIVNILYYYIPMYLYQFAPEHIPESLNSHEPTHRVAEPKFHQLSTCRLISYTRDSKMGDMGRLGNRSNVI